MKALREDKFAKYESVVPRGAVIPSHSAPRVEYGKIKGAERGRESSRGGAASDLVYRKNTKF